MGIGLRSDGKVVCILKEDLPIAFEHFYLSIGPCGHTTFIVDNKEEKLSSLLVKFRGYKIEGDGTFKGTHILFKEEKLSNIQSIEISDTDKYLNIFIAISAFNFEVKKSECCD